MSENDPPPNQELTLGLVLKRAIRLRCPHCGEGKLFKGYIVMNERCDHCNLKYEDEPGYFLGSTYINYGVTMLLVTFAYLILHFLYGIRRLPLSIFMAIFILLFAPFFHRYARSFWLALDKWFVFLASKNLPGDDQWKE